MSQFSENTFSNWIWSFLDELLSSLMNGRAYFSAGRKSFVVVDISEDRLRWFLFYKCSRRFISKIRIYKSNLRWLCGALKEASQGNGNLCCRWDRKIEAYLYRTYQILTVMVGFVQIEVWLGDRKSLVIILETIDIGVVTLQKKSWYFYGNQSNWRHNGYSRIRQ